MPYTERDVEWYRDSLRKLGFDSRSANKNYLSKKYHIYENKLIIIQSYVRRWLCRRKYVDLLAQDPKKILVTVNDCTLVGESLNTIDQDRIYILKEHNQYYGFSLEEIWEWVCKNNHGTNPYTTNIIPEVSVNQIKRLYQKIYGTKLITTINSPSASSYSAQLADFFIRIEALGCYANIEGYKSFTETQLLAFFKSLYNDYESIQNIITYEQYQTILNASLSTEPPAPPAPPEPPNIREQILIILNKLLTGTQEEMEDRALIFSLHLSKCLSPNNDELEHYYLNNINYLIQNIILQNTYSETFDDAYEEGTLDSIFDGDIDELDITASGDADFDSSGNDIEWSD